MGGRIQRVRGGEKEWTKNDRNDTRDWSLLSLTGGSLYSTRDRNIELAQVRCGESRAA